MCAGHERPKECSRPGFGCVGAMSLKAAALIRQAAALNRSGHSPYRNFGKSGKLHGGKLLSLFTNEGPRNFTQLQHKFWSIQTISRLRILKVI